MDLRTSVVHARNLQIHIHTLRVPAPTFLTAGVLKPPAWTADALYKSTISNTALHAQTMSVRKRSQVCFILCQ